MKVRDKELKKDVDVSCKDCLKFECYWARPHPGIFKQGSGYTNTAEMQKRYGYICGTREVRGCPEKPKQK
jgi:hypothetical protein